MHERPPSWTRSVLLGALLGLVLLGVLGRVAMRVIAGANGAAAAFTVEGTLTVLLSGAAAGAAAGAILRGLAAVLPARPRLRTVLFLVILAALTARGLRPIQPLALALFGPAMAIFAGAYLAVWRRLAPAAAERAPSPATSPRRAAAP